MRRIARRAAQKCADAIGRRRDLFDHLLELHNHLARVANDFLLVGNPGAHCEQFAPERRARIDLGDDAVKRLQDTQPFHAGDSTKFLEIVV